jgi:hypothetical protein
MMIDHKVKFLSELIQALSRDLQIGFDPFEPSGSICFSHTVSSDYPKLWVTIAA